MNKSNTYDPFKVQSNKIETVISASFFGSTLKHLRTSKKLSQDELANKVGVTRTSVTNYESGVAIPSVKVLIRLCEILNVTPDVILGYSTRLNKRRGVDK